MARGRKPKATTEKTKTMEEVVEEATVTPVQSPPAVTKGSTSDGPRYAASLLKDKTRKDMTCYKDFYESESKEETIEEANDAAMDSGLPVIVFDRKEHWIIHRFDPQAAAAELDKEESTKKGKK